MLPNGNVLLALAQNKTYPAGAVVEVCRAGKTAFEYPGAQGEVNTILLLVGGRGLLAEAGDRPRAREVGHDGKGLAGVPFQAGRRTTSS